jgi:hypothetical protein
MKNMEEKYGKMKCFITSFTRKAIQVTDILNVSI